MKEYKTSIAFRKTTQRVSIDAEMQTSKMNAMRARAVCCRILSGGKAELQVTGEFWRVAWAEGVGACVWYRQGMNRDAFGQSVFQTCIEQPLRAQATHALTLRQINAAILKCMRESSIDCMTLRGQGIAEALYHPSTSRPQMDIDLLVNELDIQAAIRIVTQSGFELAKHHSLLFFRGGVLLDLHTDPLDMERIRARKYLTPMQTQDFFSHAERSQLAGASALLPLPRVNLPYLCFHAMKHSFERLVWLWDIALLSNNIQEEDQWCAVLDGIREYRLERPCFYALSYVRTHLNAFVPQDMLEAIRPRMDLRERNMYTRFMGHEVIPFLAERLFSRMMPDFRRRVLFWKETIVPREQVRAQIVGEGCLHCGFIRKRLRQLTKALWMLVKETWTILRLH